MPQFYNANLIRWLGTDWGINVVRASMAVSFGGYLDHPDREVARIRTVVEAAIAEDLYVIIDWHSHLDETDAAASFFSEMSQCYGSYPNVIFEPWNEPDARYRWSAEIRSAHQAVITAIRHHAPHSLVIVGTENFSQRVDLAAADPIEDTNTAYTLHFYAASHRELLRQRTRDALDAGIAIVATEYGTCEADGNGIFSPRETMRWWRFLEANGIGCVNWAISDKAETAAALLPGSSAEGNWPLSQLTPSGLLVRGYLRARAHTAIIESETDSGG